MIPAPAEAVKNINKCCGRLRIKNMIDAADRMINWPA